MSDGEQISKHDPNPPDPTKGGLLNEGGVNDKPNHLRTADTDLRNAERRDRAVQLRAAGFTYEKIGKALNVSRERAGKIVREELANCRRETAEAASELRDIAHRRHESLINRLWLKAMPNDPSEPMDYNAVDRILRAVALDAKIMGYEAPTQHRIDVHQMQTSITMVVDMICNVLPDEYAPKVYEVVERAAKQLESEHGTSQGE